jgi:hypothetical protein
MKQSDVKNISLGYVRFWLGISQFLQVPDDL